MTQRSRYLGVAVGLGGVAFAQEAGVDPATTAWMLISTALVLLMTPGLAFFYGGLVRAKNVLNTMMMSFAALGAVGMSWVLVGYSLAYDTGSAFIGGFGHLLLRGLGLEGEGIPPLLDVAFQGTFAIIAAALISGGIVERMRFGAYLAFITLWSLTVYAPLAHWVWGGGWLAEALDFAGGTVVHINAGVAALVAALVVGPRKDHGRQAILPHNVPFVLLGAALLWFGWFGFNGGSAYAADGTAALAFTNTFLAPAATLVVWGALDGWRAGRITAVGAATAIVVGLVAVTPAAGFVGPLGALWIGALAAFPSYLFILWRARSRMDDALDVFGTHGLGGITGALLTGVLASAEWGGTPGLLEGNAAQLWLQAQAVLYAVGYSAAATFVLLRLVGAFTPLRASAKEEGVGLDVNAHGEEAYTTGEGAVLLLDVEGQPQRLSAGGRA
ncbi:ammonium transporter [Marinithermus hydrothermalis]|uniref:Ammonium transporter n=1 Tax=Marinithermus hydrothermalis (strain DSM 14884 / JCM 11576 / T1) TaxID=869210 RepID=F2NNQ0_MARHT|nr:ammonium transporter [Marinithermus hydrothermalis]AEB11065.1 ammonium transporter [Marinithermus hydrothermalis DSM 14884]